MQNIGGGASGRGQYQHITNPSYPAYPNDPSQPFRFYDPGNPSTPAQITNPSHAAFPAGNLCQGFPILHAIDQSSFIDPGARPHNMASPQASGSRLPASSYSSGTDRYLASSYGRGMSAVELGGAIEDEGESMMMEEDEMGDDGDQDEDQGGEDEPLGEGARSTGPPHKRPRQTLKRGTACANCRVKKLKCTGERPVCSVCENSKKPVECVYETFVKKKPKVQRLRTKVQQLEDQIKQKEEELRGLEILGSARGTAAPAAMPLPFSNALVESHMGGSQSILNYNPLPGISEVAGYRAPHIADGPIGFGGHDRYALQQRNLVGGMTTGFPLQLDTSVPPPSTGSYPTSSGSIPSYMAEASPGMGSPGNRLNPGMTNLQLGRHGSLSQEAGPSLPNSNSPQFRPPPYPSHSQSSRGSRFGQTLPPKSPVQPDYAGMYAPFNRGDGAQVTTGDRPVITIKMMELGFSTESGFIAVAPGSAAEYALLYYALPYAASFNLPMHEVSILDTLATDNRVHPSLLYTLYTISTYSLTRQIPFPPATQSIPSHHPLPNGDVFKCVIGLEDMFYERAKMELERNIRTGSKLLDLAKASAGMALYLLKRGRWVEAWCLPTIDLVVACGLHRISPKFVAEYGRRNQYPPTRSIGSSQSSVQGYPGHHGSTTTLNEHEISPAKSSAPLPYRTKVVLSPPVSSAADLWERLETLWAAVEIDWGIASQFYWAEGLALENIESPWPLRLSDIQPGNLQLDQLEDPKSLGKSNALPPRALPPRARLLALQSLGLAMMATKLSDSPRSISQLRSGSTHTEPNRDDMSALQELQNGLQAFRERLMSSLPEPSIALNEPDWIYAQANLAVAEVIFYSERAVHQSFTYEYAVNAARRMVGLVRGLNFQVYAHLHCFVFNNISIVARFLYKEAERLRHHTTDSMSASSAQADADLLLHALDDLAGAWCPMGKILADDVRRLKLGLPGKEGAFKR